MQVMELGQLNGRVLLFGGPYSNLQATRALLDQAHAWHIPATHMICTGDVVAYCAAPVATIAAIRASGCTVLAGNCEKQLAAGAPDCGCGFEEGTTCDLLSAGWYAHADRHVGPDDRAWMAKLPDIITFWHQGRRCAVLHGGVTDIARFIWPNSPEDTFASEWRDLEAAIGYVDLVIAGHSGLPFTRQTPKGPWINAGVIGMPPHDARPETCFAVLENAEATHHRLTYDVDTAQTEMQRAGLTQGYHESLQSGYWPSEDVLPASLRRSAAPASG